MFSSATKPIVAISALLSYAAIFSGSAFASEVNFLSGSAFEKVATAHNIDPILLYSVSLAESRKFIKSENATYPHQLVVRSPEGAKYFNTREAAVKHLDHVVATYKKYEIDVCAMQINLGWNGHLVDHNYSALFDIETCLNAGSTVLKKAMTSEKDDAELAIGRYHTWKDQDRARRYGRSVIAIWNALKEYSKS